METENIIVKLEERTNEDKPELDKTSNEQKSNLSGRSDIDEDKINKKINIDNKAKSETETHKAKAETVKKLAEKIKNSKTLMIVSIKNLPSKQFQNIKKSLRGKAVVRVAKKNIMLRAIKEFGKESILPLEKQIQENFAFVISDIEGFELAGILSKEKTSSSAKAGQIAPEDIEVKAGPTSLVPGPAISELGALGIQISIEEGKISIKAPKVIIKKDDKINEGAASILKKLDIHPFKVGLEPIAVYDIQTGKIYLDIKIDSEETVEDLRSASVKALGLAQKIVYYCKETIGYLLAKANAEGEGLSKNIKTESVSSQEPKEEENSSSKEQQDNKGEKKEELAEEKPEEKKEEPVEEKSKEPATDSSSEQPITDTKEKNPEEKENDG